MCGKFHRSPCSQTLRFPWLALAVLIVSTAQAFPNSFEAAQAKHEARLEAAVERLTSLRAEIRGEQIPLAQELNVARANALELEAEIATIRAVKDSKHLDIQDLQNRVDSLEKEYDYITLTLFGEYFATCESTFSAGETESYGEAFREFNLLLEDQTIGEAQILDRSLDLVSLSLERIQSVIGGNIYSGDCLDSQSSLVSGSFIQAGPVLYFADPESNQAGIVEESPGLRPRIRALGDSNVRAILDFAAGKSELLPMDPSLKHAMLLLETRDHFFEHLDKGGVWVYPILFFALMSSLVAIYKSIQIFSIKQPGAQVPHQLAKLIKENSITEAEALAAKQPRHARELLEQAIEHADEPVELIEEVMYETMMGVQPRLERFLNIIAVTAATAPLLGLLGTVTGIIKTFNLMNVYGAGDPKPLISGISEALITTELGLILAIPALVIHAILTRKSAGILSRLETLSIALVNSLSRRSTANRRPVETPA